MGRKRVRQKKCVVSSYHVTHRSEENRAINQKKPIKAPKINKLMKNAKTINYFTISIIIIIILCKIVPHPAKESNGKCRKEIKKH